MRFLIVDDFHSSIFTLLEKQGWEYNYQPDITREEIKLEIRGYDGLLIRSKTSVDEELIALADQLMVVGRAGSGLENIDSLALGEKGIHVVNAPEGNRDAVGDHTMGLILGLTKNIARSSMEIKNEGLWQREENRGRELNNLTVGIIGFGNTGAQVVKRLLPFGCRVLVYDKFVTGFGGDQVQECSLEELQKEVEVLSLHLPLTSDTKALVSTEFINSCKHLEYIINTSRGEILDTKALVKGLSSGKLKGAALDVIENEKIHKLSHEELKTFDFLRKSKDVILTPHVAGWSKESHIRLNEVLIDKIKDLF